MPNPVNDIVNRDARGDFTGLVPPHAVGDDADTEFEIEAEAVFVRGTDPAPIGGTPCAKARADLM
jgi:hypothetical protein